MKQNLEKYHVSGASIAIIDNYKLVWVGGIGYSNLKKRIHVNNNTLFQIGSLTKPFTAIIALKSAENMLVDLETDVNRYLNDWQIGKNKFTKNRSVSLKHLLTHTSGLKSEPFKGYSPTSKLPSPIEQLRGSSDANVPSPTFIDYPGKHFVYSNFGFEIIGKVLEDIYDADFQTIFHNNITVNLGLKNTIYLQTLPQALLSDSTLATPYDDYQKPYQLGGTVFVAKGVAGLWSTASDLAKFVIAIQEGLKQDNGPIQADIAKQMIEPVVRRDKTIAASLGFDSILQNKQYFTNRVDNYFMKTGAQLGFTAALIGSSYGGKGAVVLLNACTDHNTEPLPKASNKNACLTIKKNSFGLRSLIIRKIAEINSW